MGKGSLAGIRSQLRPWVAHGEPWSGNDPAELSPVEARRPGSIWLRQPVAEYITQRRDQGLVKAALFHRGLSSEEGRWLSAFCCQHPQQLGEEVLEGLEEGIEGLGAVPTSTLSLDRDTNLEK